MPKIALAVTDKRGHYIGRVQGHMLGIYIYVRASKQNTELELLVHPGKNRTSHIFPTFKPRKPILDL